MYVTVYLNFEFRRIVNEKEKVTLILTQSSKVQITLLRCRWLLCIIIQLLLFTLYFSERKKEERKFSNDFLSCDLKYKICNV